MGRRKIEIKAIKDDRNRSVTFLKRKGGLFKKAHELSVLCSVDVAVIIFGHNKKLYEFSSGDINETIGRYQYYGGPHEHKGPEDFNGKKEAGSDDEDEEGGSPRPESRSPPQHAMMAHHLQQQPAFQHMGTPHASPPMPNGAFPHRGPSPSAQNLSRPGSRTHMRHPSGPNLLPPQHPQMQVSQPQQPQQSYAYMPNPPIYNPQQAAVMGPHPQQVTPQIRFTGPPPQHPPQHPQMHPQQVPQMYQPEQRQQSMPPNFAPQPEQRPPQAPQQQQQPVPSPQPQQQQFNSPPPPQPKPLSQDAKTHSIFTPIDDSRSLLARHWGSTSTQAEMPARTETTAKQESNLRSQSIDVASINRSQPNGINPTPQPPPVITTTSQPPVPQRTASTPVLPSMPPHPPSRTNSLQTNRPRLRVEIPNENEDEGDSKPTGAPSPNRGNTAITPIREPGHNGVVLPPPSPSTSALLSAGASGPPNPFARPPPPMNGFTSDGKRSEVDTPASALPSRFVNAELLQSPSNFYSNWSFDRESNMLPSPLTFQTPVVPLGSAFDDVDRKRKISDGGEGGSEKRIKT